MDTQEFTKLDMRTYAREHGMQYQGYETETEFYLFSKPGPIGKGWINIAVYAQDIKDEMALYMFKHDLSRTI